jgi:hypothetical protein
MSIVAMINNTVVVIMAKRGSIGGSASTAGIVWTVTARMLNAEPHSKASSYAHVKIRFMSTQLKSYPCTFATDWTTYGVLPAQMIHPICKFE